MQLSKDRPQALLFMIVGYLIWASVSLRWIMVYLEQQVPFVWLIVGILFLYAILLGLEPRITRGSELRTYLYLVFQTGLILFASLFHYELDFFALLYLPLCGQAMYLLPRPRALMWVAILIVVTFIGQMIQFGWPEGLSFFLLYSAGLVFVAAYSILTIQAEESRRKTESLLAELQQAHIQLQEFAGQAEELAIEKERNRLARELHDSVAQTLYGLTLQSEAGLRKMLNGQIEVVADYLREIRDSAHDTLQETRLLIFELRSPALEKDGLTVALERRLEAVEGRSGIKTELDFELEEGLPTIVEESLYRIALEALNNALKHAKADQVSVSLIRHKASVELMVCDNGVGFDPDTASAGGGMGLKGMQERADQIGGRLVLSSAPVEGTCVKVEVPL